MSTRYSAGRIALIGSAALHASLLYGMSLADPAASAESALSPEIDAAATSPEARPTEDLGNDVAAAPKPAMARRMAAGTPPRTRSLPAEPGTTNVTAPSPPDALASDGAPAPLHFVMSASPAASNAREGQGEIVYAEDGVDARPRLVAWQPPKYPPTAASAGVEVDVPVDVVIDAEGAVTEVRLPKHFGYGLDEAATAAARSYRFSRGLRAGRPVRVRMRCTVVFRLN